MGTAPFSLDVIMVTSQLEWVVAMDSRFRGNDGSYGFPLTT